MYRVPQPVNREDPIDRRIVEVLEAHEGLDDSGAMDHPVHRA